MLSFQNPVHCRASCVVVWGRTDSIKCPGEISNPSRRTRILGLFSRARWVGVKGKWRFDVLWSQEVQMFCKALADSKQQLQFFIIHFLHFFTQRQMEDSISEIRWVAIIFEVLSHNTEYFSRNSTPPYFVVECIGLDIFSSFVLTGFISLIFFSSYGFQWGDVKFVCKWYE